MDGVEHCNYCEFTWFVGRVALSLSLTHTYTHTTHTCSHLVTPLKNVPRVRSCRSWEQQDGGMRPGDNTRERGWGPAGPGGSGPPHGGLDSRRLRRSGSRSDSRSRKGPAPPPGAWEEEDRGDGRGRRGGEGYGADGLWFFFCMYL